MNYEIRKIDRPIEECNLREQAAFGNSGATNKPMIAETEAQAIARAQHWDDVSDSITVAFMNTPFQKQFLKIIQRRLDILAAGQLSYALQCRHEFDAEACRAQFNAECA